MAQDTIDKAIQIGAIPGKPCKTEHLPIHGFLNDSDLHDPLRFYGSDIAPIKQLVADDPSLGALLVPNFPYNKAMVLWAIRNEYARRVEDVLGRRLRLLFLDVHAALAAAPVVAELMAKELGKEEAWVKAELADFTLLAKGYTLN
jgi:glycerol-3-phosphate dehydrogenase